MRSFVVLVLLLTVSVQASANDGASCEAGEINVVLESPTAAVVFRDHLNKLPGLMGRVKVPAEGSLLPGSYCVLKNTSRAKVVRQMRDAMTQVLAQEWASRSSNAVVSTVDEALILASLVQAEAILAADFPMIAAVYSNRLRHGIKLQADRTIIYPITKGRPLDRRILISELRDDNGYNTYEREGLPKGPITNPSVEAIRAVLNPARSDALFFVSDGRGGYVFANTLEEQNANVEKWYAIRRQRDEM